MSALTPGERPLCSVAGCGRPSFCRTWCTAHYERWRVHGDPSIAGRSDRLASVRDRMLGRIKADEAGCWLWTASVTASGYARVKHQGRTHSGHRLMYELTVGPVPADLDLDHLCRVRRCINPAHLEPVTARENTMRSPIAPAARNAAKTECLNGHPFNEANTFIDARGMRQCKTCRRATTARYRSKVRRAA